VAECNDIRFRHVDERCGEGARRPITPVEGVPHREGELRTTIGVDRVIAGMRGVCDFVRIATYCNRAREGEKEHVAIRYDCCLHQLVRVVAFGYVDSLANLTRARAIEELFSDVAQVERC
jgi:hypothetical protein